MTGPVGAALVVVGLSLGLATAAHAQAAPAGATPPPPPHAIKVQVEAGGTFGVAQATGEDGAVGATRFDGSLDVRVVFPRGIGLGLRFGLQPLLAGRDVMFGTRDALLDLNLVHTLAVGEVPLLERGAFALRAGLGVGLLLVRSQLFIDQQALGLPDDVRSRTGWGAGGRATLLALWGTGAWRLGLEAGVQAGRVWGLEDFQDGARLPDTWTTVAATGGLVVRYRR